MRKDLWRRHLRVSHENGDLSPLDDPARTKPSETAFDNTVSEAYVQGTSIEGSRWDSNTSVSLLDESLRDASLQSQIEQDVSAKMSEEFEENPEACLPVTHDSFGLWTTSFEESWIQELEEWRSDFCTHQNTRFTDTDMQWFFDTQQPLELEQDSVQRSQSLEHSNPAPLRDISTITSEIYNVNGQLPPVYLQESQSKIFVAKTGEFDPPSCGFQVCNGLTNERRIELLMDLRNISNFDLRDPIFSLNSMKQGIHLFCRNVNSEYAFVHHQFICPSSQEHRQAIIDVLGEEPGSQLIWIIITLGWSLMRSDNNHEYQMASTIQRVIRTSIINVNPHPPLQSHTDSYCSTLV